ncbi:MAG TPA: hypothetical protein VJN96_09100 [Vicinamibacterales bacterium]|nr:hypothetical protein [Vicinamibacterales bacterium]
MNELSRGGIVFGPKGSDRSGAASDEAPPAWVLAFMVDLHKTIAELAQLRRAVTQLTLELEHERRARHEGK